MPPWPLLLPLGDMTGSDMWGGGVVSEPLQQAEGMLAQAPAFGIGAAWMGPLDPVF